MLILPYFLNSVFYLKEYEILELNKIRPFKEVLSRKTRLHKCLYKTAYLGLPNPITTVESHFLFRVLFLFGFNLGLFKIKIFIWLCGSWFLHMESLTFHRGV